MSGERTVWDAVPPMLPVPQPDYPYADWNPYCMRCQGLVRMRRTAFGWECSRHRIPVGPDLIVRVGPFARAPVEHVEPPPIPALCHDDPWARRDFEIFNEGYVDERR